MNEAGNVGGASSRIVKDYPDYPFDDIILDPERFVITNGFYDRWFRTNTWLRMKKVA